MARGKPLVMREWAFGQPLATGVWGIREPTAEAAEAWPDILLVPLAVFDRKGNRIGYGAGYYDLTINRAALAQARDRDRARLSCAACRGGAIHARATRGSISC